MTTPLFEQPAVRRRRWFLLAVLNMSLLLVIMSLAGLNVALASLQAELGIGVSGLQWVSNAYTIAFGGLLLTAGAIGDRFGRKGALEGGLLVFAGAALVGGLADDAATIIAARAVMGLGAAFVMPATLSLISNIFEPSERDKAIAIWAGFAGVGGALGPLLSGLLISGWWIVPAGGWELALLYNVPIGLIVLAMIALWVPQSREPIATPLDPVGAAVSLLSVSGLLFGIIEGPERGWASPEIVVALVGAVVAGFAFVVWERTTDHPMLPLGLFSDRRFAVGAAVNTMAFVTLLGFWFLLVLYVQFALGYSPLQAGLATLPEAIAGTMIAPVTPRLSRRFGRPAVMAVGFGLLAVSFGLLGLAGPTTGYGFLAGPIALAGIGLSLTTIPATNDIMTATPLSKAGVGSAVNDVSREVGAAIGIATLGTIAFTIYRDAFDVTAVPAELAAEAGETPGAAIDSATGLDVAQADALVRAVGEAFSHAFARTMTIAGAASLVAAVAVVVTSGRPTGRAR